MKKMKGFFIILMFFSSFFVLSLINYQISPIQAKLDDNPSIEAGVSTPYSQQWLSNPTMDSPITEWSTASGGADPSDVTAIDGGDQANMTVVGDSGTYTVFSDPPSSSDWTAYSNPDFPIMPYADDGPGGTLGWGIDAGGLWAWHEWSEGGAGGQLGQTPSVEWKRNVTTPVNMSDYEITSASLTAICNGTVDSNIDTVADGGTVAVGDYTRFYVAVSDLSGEQEYEVASNQTVQLGTDSGPLTQGNTIMVQVPEPLLIAILTSILEADHYNFTIILGIFIYCEDNNPTYDNDYWTLLRINSFNLTFSYEKKIDKTSYIEWSQVGNQLPTTPGTLIVDSARLHFQYRIDQAWPTADSPNSEIRALINGIEHSETVDLSTANGSLQDNKAGGYDVTSLIKKGVNISLSIRLYLADDFLRPTDIILSIDNVYLWINYTITLIEPSMSVAANATYLITNQYTNITVSCTSGTGNIDTWWYYNPIDDQNYTLATGFSGTQIRNIVNTTGNDGAYTYKFWANSTIGLEDYEQLIVVWIDPILPALSVTANATTMFTNQFANITVTCSNETGNVDTWWYFNPIDGQNHTLATDFSGTQIHNIINTTGTAGPYVFRFWANSTLGFESYDDITIVWNTPQGPILNVVADETSPYINQYTNITVTCQSGSANVHTLWYFNPIDNQNYTLATDFSGLQIHYIYNTTGIDGSYTYQFWANSTLGADAVKSLLIVWVVPQDPIVTVTADDTSPYINHYTNLTVICQSGSGNVDTFWYYNPLDTQNHTLGSDFSGIQIHYIYNTTGFAGSYTYRFWANSSLGLLTYETFTVFWTTPLAPIITVDADITNPFVNNPTNITSTCQSGSGNVDTFWYYNPLDDQNHTLATDFAGAHIVNIINTSGIAGSYTYRFWANSSLGLKTKASITIVWINPQPPVLTVIANPTSPYVNQDTNITVTCQSGTGNTDLLWYYNPLDDQNHTLGNDFSGSQIHNIINTTGIAGAYTYHFWANSTFGLLVTEEITIFWLDLQAPILNVISNDTNPLINEWTMLTITCQSTSGNVDTLWYWDDVNDQNVTLDTDFSGSRIHVRYHTTGIAGAYLFEFWANSTFGLQTYTSLPVVWTDPQAPIVNVIANITTLYATEYTQLIITCQSGTGNIDHVWYEDLISGQNITLATNFAGNQIFRRNHTSSTAIPVLFRVWANSTLGLETMDDITIVWLSPNPPTLTLSVSKINPNAGQNVRFTIVCKAGTGNVSVVWYYNPITGQNETLNPGGPYFGEQTFFADAKSADAGTFDFEFWANSTYGVVAYDSIPVVWSPKGVGPITYVLIAALAAVAAAFLAYQLFFKVPKTVRTIRKTKSAIKKGKATTPLKVPPRESVVNEMFTKRMKMQKVPTKKPEAPGVKVIKKSV